MASHVTSWKSDVTSFNGVVRSRVQTNTKRNCKKVNIINNILLKQLTTLKVHLHPKLYIERICQ